MVGVRREVNKTAPVVTPVSPYYSCHLQPLHTLYPHQEPQERTAQDGLWVTGAKVGGRGQRVNFYLSVGKLSLALTVSCRRWGGKGKPTTAHSTPNNSHTSKALFQYRSKPSHIPARINTAAARTLNTIRGDCSLPGRCSGVRLGGGLCINSPQHTHSEAVVWLQ